MTADIARDGRDRVVPTPVRVVWWRYDQAPPERLTEAADLLSSGERARLERLRFERDRRQFLASRLLLRRVLSEVDGRPPASLRFSTDTPGVRPELVGTPAERPLRFSLTHTEGLVACALTWVIDVGIDAEPLGRRPVSSGVVSRVLAPEERAALAEVAPDAHDRRFLEYWCAKEARLKAMGTGLRASPADLVVAFDAGRAPGFVDAPSSAAWQLWLDAPGGSHVLAVACRPGGGQPVEIVTGAFDPTAPPQSRS